MFSRLKMIDRKSMEPARRFVSLVKQAVGAPVKEIATQVGLVVVIILERWRLFAALENRHASPCQQAVEDIVYVLEFLAQMIVSVADLSRYETEMRVDFVCGIKAFFHCV